MLKDTEAEKENGRRPWGLVVGKVGNSICIPLTW